MMFNYDFKKINFDIESSLRQISKNGKEESTMAMIDELSLQNESTAFSQFQDAISTVQEYSSIYDGLFEKMTDVLDSFKEKLLQRNSDNTGVEADNALNLDLKGLKESLKDILNQKHKGEYLFSGDKVFTKPFESDIFQGNGKEVVLLTGEHQFNTKLIDSSFLEGKNGSILEDLEKIISSGSSIDLDIIDGWLNKVKLKHVSVGVNESSVNLKQDYYKHINMSSEELFKSKYENLPEVIAKYQGQLLQYQAMATAFEKTSSLSLVNYV